MAKKLKGNLPRASAEDARRIVDLLDRAIVKYDGDVGEVEQALGAYLFARHVGWKPLVLIHNKRTIRKFEEVLGVSFREEFDEIGPDAERCKAYQIASGLSNFWKAVSGEVKIEGRRTIT